MKNIALFVFAVGCSPGVDFDLPPIDLGGSTNGDRGVASFIAVDGCPGDSIFGCPTHAPPLALGATTRYIVASIDGDGPTNDALARATARSAQPAVATVDRLADGTLAITARAAPSIATIELVDDGDVIDSLTLNTGAIDVLAPTDESTVVLAGTRIGARVEARSGSEVLYARGAIQMTASGALAVLPDNSGFFSASEQIAVGGNAPGDAMLTFSGGGHTVDVPYTVVTPSDITRIAFGTDVLDAHDTNRVPVFASAYVGDAQVRGGGACSWQIVSGSPNASLSPLDGDDTDSAVLPLDNGAMLFGQGDIVVECRASPTVAAHVTVRLHP
jgi:hypothetical protein